MEKIDELFGKSLKNLEVKPSERANTLFETRLNQKKGGNRRAWIYWSMAASIGFVFFAIYGILLKNNSDKLQIAANDISETKIEISEKKATENSGDLKSNTGQNIKILESGNLKMTKGKTFLDENIKLVVSGEQQGIPIISEDSKPSQIAMAQSEVKMDNSGKVRSAINEDNIEAVVYLSPLMSLNSETIKQVISLPKVEKKTSNQDYFNDEKSLIVRVAEEVKGLKKGEKVDFNKLGIKPIEEWSKDEDGFIASETREFKERYTRIKTFLTSK
ncbi:MAG: hypothetical protein LCH67_10535 [Bacteroidetes bacterium]|nr:hypothetical protein [Bacteroidota bacterium]